ncbi:hypothetical protein CEXT_565781 [Caerostris extrusa]|uniref:Uncharacterized protein n=1 Tax=Caerostris extrusa TaxID=172846 RepID=A0AAV4NBK0_CAEEX|nr:hypothetical protein CEXT_565781 [Caerostris extrusa]
MKRRSQLAYGQLTHPLHRNKSIRFDFADRDSNLASVTLNPIEYPTSHHLFLKTPSDPRQDNPKPDPLKEKKKSHQINTENPPSCNTPSLKVRLSDSLLPLSGKSLGIYLEHSTIRKHGHFNGDDISVALPNYFGSSSISEFFYFLLFLSLAFLVPPLHA